MNMTDILLLTQGENQLSTSTSITEKSGPIKWTNRYDLPPGYIYNEEGWVELPVPYPRVSITSPAFLSNKYYTPIAFLLQNLLAMRFLNNKPHELLLQILVSKFKKHGYFYTPKELEWVRKESLKINSIKDFPPMDRSIFRWETLWSSSMGRAQVNKRKTMHRISDVRENMDISRKYKTKPVKEEADTTLYAVKEYWLDMGWDAKTRSRRAILEALEENENATVKELAETTGYSLPTVRKYLPKNEK